MFVKFGIICTLLLTTLNMNTALAYAPTQNHQTLSLAENLHRGKILKLTDGSMWEIAPQDQSITQVWIFPAEVTIEDSQDPNFPNYIINQETKTKVLAKPHQAYTPSNKSQG